MLARKASARGKTSVYRPVGMADLMQPMGQKQTMANENLFFFTDQDYFRTTRFEFVSEKDAGVGFVFALLNPKPLRLEEIDAVSELSEIVVKEHGKEIARLDLLKDNKGQFDYRMLKNLGSRILDVKPYDGKSTSGFIVTYNEGD
mmetsp:Transcript_32680/g.40469  ORF Transcript_32680/g.40469 Transcript_32680/m.40469 type:complete len:145 (+) Transcript_32680:1143-1577(+)